MERLHKMAVLGKSALPAILLLVASGLIYGYLMGTAPKPTADPTRIEPRRVRVFRAEKGSRRLTVTAYGTSRSSRQWTAVAEVAGRAIYVDDRFEVGEILPANTVLVRIDPTDYRLAESRLLADVSAQEAQVVELEQKETNLRKIIALQSEQLGLADEEYRRLRALWEKKAASDSAMDAAQSAMIGYQAGKQDTQNQLDLIPVQRRLLDASLQALGVQLEQARRDLEKCTIVLPLAARCASKAVEVSQFVAAGERLGTFLALDTAEVVVMVEPRKLRALFPHGIKELGALDLTKVDLDDSLFKQMDIPAEVRWGPGERPQVWHGRVTRLGSGLDQATQSLPVIVEVPNPYKNVVPGVRPPLVADLFCQVTFQGATVDDVVVVPRDCLHEFSRDARRPSAESSGPAGQPYCVYLLRDDKLHIADVEVLVLEKDHAVIERGVDDGDLVVLTDLFPASEGMPLVGELDETVEARLAAAPAEAKGLPERRPGEDAPSGADP